MNICKFCNNKKADKKNTHYLTDAIIRRCLNINGSNEREKGFYFSINNEKPYIEHNFQRLSEDQIKSIIGRLPTDEEIEKAKKIPFSVDNIFCSECEKKFTEIEEKFINKILKKFREEDLTDKYSIEIDENIICRNFFYLQIYRSAVCNPDFELDSNFTEKLRKILYEKRDDYSIPLSVTYLQTTDKAKYYTENIVGYTSDKNPYIIFLCDFVIQVYDDVNNINFLELYGLNNEETYTNFININKKAFNFCVLQNDERKKFISELKREEKAKPLIKELMDVFCKIYYYLTSNNPSEIEKGKFLNALEQHISRSIISLSPNEIICFFLRYFSNLNLSN